MVMTARVAALFTGLVQLFQGLVIVTVCLFQLINPTVQVVCVWVENFQQLCIGTKCVGLG